MYFSYFCIDKKVARLFSPTQSWTEQEFQKDLVQSDSLENYFILSIRNSMTLLLIHKSQNSSSRTLNYFSWLHRRQLPIFFVLLFSLNFLFSVEVVYCCFNEVADRMKVLRLYFDKSRKSIFVGWRRITCTQVPDTPHTFHNFLEKKVLLRHLFHSVIMEQQKLAESDEFLDEIRLRLIMLFPLQD